MSDFILSLFEVVPNGGNHFVYVINWRGISSHIILVLWLLFYLAHSQDNELATSFQIVI